MSAHMKPTRKRAAPGRPALPDSERRDLKVQISLSGPEAAIFVARSRGGSLAATIRDHALAGVRAGVEIDAPRAGRAARDSALGEALRRVADAWPMEDVTSLVDSLRLGCEIAYQREPTQEEGDAHEYCHDQSMGASHGSGECFVPMGSHHGRKCKCGTWVWGGPTVCQRCVDADAVTLPRATARRG